MNSTALQIYSFLMSQEIEFIRYCHPVYDNYTQWTSILKKSRQEVELPVYHVFRQKNSGCYVLSMYFDKTNHSVDDDLMPASEKETAELCEILHCQPHTLSPLGLLFDQQYQCQLQIDNMPRDTKIWCLSPCSDESSVLISPDIFLNQFLPALLPPRNYLKS